MPWVLSQVKRKWRGRWGEIRATYGYAKQGSGYGYTGVKGTERAAGDRVHRVIGTGDRGDPAAERLDELRPRPRPDSSPTPW